MDHHAMPHAMPMHFRATMQSTLWLEDFQTTGPVTFGLTLLGLFLLCLAQEALHHFRADHARRASSAAPEYEAVEPHNSRRPSSGVRLQSSLLYALNLAIAYLLMLAVMTYVVSYFVVIVLGLAVGHYVFFRDASSAGATSDACCAQSAP